MTADPAAHDRRAGHRVRAHLFLLAGRHPGATHAEALADAHTYGLAAEEHGYAGVWMAEHHFISYGVCPSAVTFAGHLLGATRRISVGTAACVLSNRHPVALAEEAVLLDELSGGRFALGVGRGGPWVDLEVFGTGLPRFTDGFAESLDLLTRWLSGAPTVAGTPRFPFRPVSVVPRPRRPVPLWVAATSSSTVDLAAARGLPLLLGLHATVAEKADLLARWARVAAAHGHDPAAAGHASTHLAYVADDDATAVRAIRRALPGLLAGTREYVRIDDTPPRTRDLDRYVAHLTGIHPVGGPARCRAAVAEAAALPGVRHLLFLVEGGGGRAPTTEVVARLATEVLEPVLTCGADGDTPRYAGFGTGATGGPLE